MNREQVEEHLTQADRHVAAGTRRVLEQRELVAHLEREGLPTESATKLLQTFERTLDEMVADRERIRQELAKGDLWHRDR